MKHLVFTLILMALTITTSSANADTKEDKSSAPVSTLLNPPVESASVTLENPVFIALSLFN